MTPFDGTAIDELPLHPDDRQSLLEAVVALTPEQPRLEHTHRLLLPNGVIRWVRESARAEFAADGTLASLQGFTVDITPQKEAEERLSLVASVSEMIGAVDDPAELLYAVSRAAGEHLRARRCLFTEIDLEHDRGVVRRDYCRDVPSVAGVYRVSDYPEETRRELESGRIVVNYDSKHDPRTATRYETTYAPHGERAYVAVPLLRDGRWVAELWISDDVPRQWSEQDVDLLQSVAERAWTAVEKLRVHRALHERELEREDLLARERRLRAAADEASVAKDHFLALLSHELRTPMTTILGWASFLGTNVSDPLTIQNGIASIEQASRVQARLIDDLLDVSRIVTGKLALEEKVVDATQVVRTALDGILPVAQSAGVHIVPDLGRGPAFVLGDATRLQQIAWNLLTNAVKFTPRGGRIDVSVHEVAGAVELSVRDNGIGIDPHFLPHVFDRFRQAEDGPARRFGGLGLGLSIVRHITELHGGEVDAWSEGEGRGAEFRVRLPRAWAPRDLATPHDAEIALERDVLSGVQILVVDDDPSAREVIGTMLSGFGARVIRAASAEEAMPSIEATDVLVSDIGMPGEDGYAFLERLRSAGSPIRAIAVTAYADPRDRDRAFAVGYQAHLAKPVEPRALVGAVVKVLSTA
jgi:signal transduction histidine kinase